jgi:hypothetical protein
LPSARCRGVTAWAARRRSRTCSFARRSLPPRSGASQRRRYSLAIGALTGSRSQVRLHPQPVSAGGVASAGGGTFLSAQSARTSAAQFLPPVRRAGL